MQGSQLPERAAYGTAGRLLHYLNGALVQKAADGSTVAQTALSMTTTVSWKNSLAKSVLISTPGPHHAVYSKSRYQLLHGA